VLLSFKEGENMEHAFDHHKVSGLRVLRDQVLVAEMKFDERKTASGIVLLNDDGKNHGIRPRWAQVYAIGPEQTHVKIGQYVLVSHGRWTRGINIEDDEGKKTVRRIDNDEILLVSDTPRDDETISDKGL
jgi:co-chaperonin GroES (HSP10)